MRTTRIARLLTVGLIYGLTIGAGWCAPASTPTFQRPEFEGLLERFENYRGPLTYVSYGRTTGLTSSVMGEMSEADVLKAIGTPPTLNEQSITYFDRAIHGGEKIKVEAWYNLTSATQAFTTDDLTNAGRELRILRDKLLPVPMPPFDLDSQSIAHDGGDIFVITNGKTSKVFHGKGTQEFNKGENVLTRFWGNGHQEFVQNGTAVKETDGRTKVTAKPGSSMNAVAWFDKDGFLAEWHQIVPSGTFKRELISKSSDWKIHENLILPAKSEVRFYLITPGGERILITEYFIHLLAFGDEDYLHVNFVAPNNAPARFIDRGHLPELHGLDWLWAHGSREGDFALKLEEATGEKLHALLSSLDDLPVLNVSLEYNVVTSSPLTQSLENVRFVRGDTVFPQTSALRQNLDTIRQRRETDSDLTALPDFDFTGLYGESRTTTSSGSFYLEPGKECMEQPFIPGNFEISVFKLPSPFSSLLPEDKVEWVAESAAWNATGDGYQTIVADNGSTITIEINRDGFAKAIVQSERLPNGLLRTIERRYDEWKRTAYGYYPTGFDEVVSVSMNGGEKHVVARNVLVVGSEASK